MKFKTVSYGRTIEVGGPFGRGRKVEKVWFGWEVELSKGEKEPEVTKKLVAMADEREKQEKEAWIARNPWL